MLIFENIELALNAIKSNITRSILTMLGIIIGVAAVIGILTISDAMDSELSSIFATGIDSVFVGVTEKRDDSGGDFERGFNGRARREMGMNDYINKEMLDDVMDTFSDKIKGYKASINVYNEATAVCNGKKGYVNVYGKNPDSYNELELEIVAGHNPYDIDYEQGKRVIVVSTDLTDELFGGNPESAIGKNLSVIDENVYHNYNIIGVYKQEEDEYSFLFSDVESSDAYIPLLVGMSELHEVYKFEQINFVAKNVDDCEALADAIPEYLNKRYYSKNPGFEIEGYSMFSDIQEVTDMLSKISLGLSCVAGISLLVGGIGVMNIMLVSITERTKEIGTRKALGATNKSIMTQFVVEAIVLCLVGGFLGICLGELLGYFGCKLMETEFVFTLKSVLISFGFSAAVGIFFGYYPASKAAKMNPIDALRYE